MSVWRSWHVQVLAHTLYFCAGVLHIASWPLISPLRTLYVSLVVCGVCFDLRSLCSPAAHPVADLLDALRGVGELCSARFAAVWGVAAALCSFVQAGWLMSHLACRMCPPCQLPMYTWYRYLRRIQSNPGAPFVLLLPQDWVVILPASARAVCPVLSCPVLGRPTY